MGCSLRFCCLDMERREGGLEREQVGIGVVEGNC